jgi:hypothetical protein
MKKFKVFSIASVVALALVGVFAAKASNKFAAFSGGIYTSAGTNVGSLNGNMPVYTTDINSTTQASLDGTALFYKVSTTLHELYQ